MDNHKAPLYTEKAQNLQHYLTVCKRQHKQLSFMRLALVLSLLVAVPWAISVQLWAGLGLGFLLLSSFLFCLKRHQRIERDIELTTTLLTINQNEAACCNGQYAMFYHGSEFIDVHHPYSYDIDLFGPGSMYQYLNRCGTRFGHRALFETLTAAPLKIDDIKASHRAIAELAEMLEFRQQFLAIASQYNADQNEQALLNEWAQYPPFFEHKLLEKMALWLWPLGTFLILGFSLAGWLPLYSITLLILFNLGMLGLKMRRFNRDYALLNKSHGNLKKITGMLQLISEQHFASELLQKLQQQTRHQQKWGHEQISQLTQIINKLDYRLNFVVGFTLNVLFCWDWQYMARASRWKESHRFMFDTWTHTIGQLETLCSFANFAFNNRGLCYPEPLEAPEPFFEADTLGHPLIPYNKRIGNRFALQGSPQFAIITGANMAGKSTFLRSVALNMVLAGCGAPVCATKMRCTILPVLTSMRTEDSLQNNESYFFAELKRLQNIVNQTESSQPYFVILDEILRGTNSIDKQKGSMGFLRKLASRNAFGIIATHDLELASLAVKNQHQFKAYCFDVTIQQHQLVFDYLLKEGITQNMNASFLMLQMGIMDAPESLK